MIQGFRKFRDFPLPETGMVLELEGRFRSRRLRWARQLHHVRGPEGAEIGVWRVFVYCRDLPFAEDELNRMELQSQRKVVAIS